MTAATAIPPDHVLRASRLAARREARAEIIGKLIDAIDGAVCAGEFAGIEIGPDEAANSNLIADVLVNLQNARDAAERIR